MISTAFISFIYYMIVFLFGLMIGSFLNCLVYRLEKEEKITGRSHCPHCRHVLGWLDLVPLLSFIGLLGKCRYCHKRISAQYPLVELLTGILFVGIVYFGFNGLQIERMKVTVWNVAMLYCIFYLISSFIVIFIYDLRHYLIPDVILFPAILVALVYRLLDNWKLIGNPILSVVIASGFFLLIFLISRGKWIGFGDVKIAVLLGLVLGFPNILVGLFLSFFLGALVGVVLITQDTLAHKKKNMGLEREIPFAPFLITATFMTIFFGDGLLQWYLHFLHF